MAVDEASADLDTSPTSSQGQNDAMDSWDGNDIAAEGGENVKTVVVYKPAEVSVAQKDATELAVQASDKEYAGRVVVGNTAVKRKATEDGSHENVIKQKRSRQGMVTNHLDGVEIDKEISDEPFAFKPGVKKPDRREDIRNKQHRIVIKELRSMLEKSRGTLTIGELQNCLDMVEVLNEKYLEVTRKKMYSRKKGKHPQVQEVMMKRFEGEEERAHPWATVSHPDETPGLLMRAWDQKSQCKIENFRVGFLSGGSDHFLNTKEKRRLALEQHADWGNRWKTPFISFSSSLREIALERVPHFQKRQADSGILDNTRLTIINARARIAAGLPVLRMKDELLHYDVNNKYGNPRFQKNSFYENEYIVPFSVRPKEIVRTYSWHDIETWMKTNRAEIEDWYIKVGVEDFKEHERARLGGTPAKCKDGCDCCGQ
ncbi:hypothetical protein LCER1_G003291 [Lachnellula cervina]|uniref:DUF7587 domain-containing protein n=1 Tax=Lachnellula cervina TaxID=1316786 RepID=A0A7D8V1D9_9HELO|nr:hypothetical protein LCER1_G003291 [Lachnellula cervina]